MKKRNLLLILSVIALASCSAIETSGYQEGVVSGPQQKQDIKQLYNDSLDTTEDLEDFTEDSSEEDISGGVVESPSEEPNSPEEGEVEQTPSEDISSEEVLPNEGETSEEVETEVAPSITSYHVDYTIDYALKASVAEHEIINSSEKQTYSLTYVNDNGDVFMELDLTHYYVDTSFFGEISGSQNINVVFQDEKLYVTQKVENSYGMSHESKTSHDIKRKHIHREYRDYFQLMSINAMLDPTSRENNSALVDELLTNETVEILEVTDKTVKVQFDYEEGIATMVFDTELKAFTSVTFDKSKQQEDVVLVEETPEENGETIIEEENNEPSLPEGKPGDDHEPPHHGEDEDKPFDKEDYKLNIDLYRYLVNINFSYNDQIADKLTEEEIAEYESRGRDYGHYNDYKGYDDDYDYGYHGGRDEHHGHNDRPGHGGR